MCLFSCVPADVIVVVAVVEVVRKQGVK